MIYTADFETNNSTTECRVWSYGICCIDEYYTYSDGNNIDDFISELKQLLKQGNTTHTSTVVWFHNLSFDGEFIVNKLFRMGFTYVEGEKSRKLEPNQFSALISDMGQWYCIKICFRRGRYGIVTIQDSAKVLPFSVSEVAKSFGLEEKKGSIDYDTIRPIGYTPTAEEKEYQYNDCLIMAKALKVLFNQGHVKMTAGSNALASYRSIVNKKRFDNWFPQLTDDTDAFIRRSYKGGWVYAAPAYKNTILGEGLVFDVNSLYPSRMKFELLPYGEPRFYTGEYSPSEDYPLYVQRFNCSFELKKNKLPTVQLKGHYGFSNTEYATTSNGEIVELTMTNVDFELFKEHYNVKHLEYLDGYMFKGCYGMFDAYIDYWMDVKIDAEKRGDKAMRTLAKLMLNSLYGKFAKRPKGKSKHPRLDAEGKLEFYLGEEEDHGKLYIPVGTFITAYARNYTIRCAQKNYKTFAYADTDSLHLITKNVPKNIETSQTELGKWKLEMKFIRAKYIGPKCYLEEEKKSPADLIEMARKQEWQETELMDFERGCITKITCAGLPKKLHKEVNMDNFNVGLVVYGKLKPTHVPGGKILTKTTFEIKDRQCVDKKLKT